MGYMRHDAIVVTSWKQEHLKVARTKAEELGLPISEIVDGLVNRENSFLIAPDGSKEGWSDSDAGDCARSQWKEWVREQENMWVDWIHVSFGGDNARLAHVVDFNGNQASEAHSVGHASNSDAASFNPKS